MLLKTFPRISVITPSYNQATFLERTILSVIGQNYPNLEFIIIDGGSTDDSVSVIRKYESKISYWISEKDNGTYEANNKGLERITGDYWCVVNSDDLLLPGALEAVAKAIQHQPDVKWFAGAVKYIDEEDVVTGEQIPERPESIDGYTFFNGCWTSHPGVFLSKDTLSIVGMFEKYHLMDLNYWLRLERKGYSPVIIPEHLAALRLHKDCKSADRIKLQEEFLHVLERFVQEYKLTHLPKMKLKYRSHLLNYARVLFFEQLVKGDRRKSFMKLVSITVSFPNSFLSRWYWGGVKRLVFGLSAEDPLKREFSTEENKSNWNNLR